MSAATTIEWCDHTWSPWIGCTPVSAACDHCYAAALARRYGWARYEAGAPRRRTAPSTWRQPLAWNRKAEASGRRETVFPSLCDPFDSEVDDAWRADHFALIAATPRLEWLLLTKRPKLARQFFAGRKVPDNVRLGITAEDQKMLELRAPDILAIDWRLSPFLSAEPLLGPLTLERPLLSYAVGFDWVIAGGESGPKARHSHPDWFRSLRDQCAAAGVPFFFKQWGEWAPLAGTGYASERPDHKPDDLYRIGKKRAGAMLDGREHREFPT